MALVRRTQKSNHKVDSTVSLVEALRDFEAILSADQKLIYRSNYAKPEAQDVVVLISRIDAANKGRSGRCFAPRLCTFLDGVVQFAGVVDTFVSSNPGIAALVWGSLKTVIVVSSNVASFFEKVSNMIMEIGRTCPTYQQFGQLYPSSMGLQTALCEYFAIIVRICTRVLLISQRSGIAQIAMPIFSPFEAEFQKYRGDLALAVREIELQVSLASKQVNLEMAKLAEMEGKRNTTHRDLMRRFQSNTNTEFIELRRRLEAREEMKIKDDILTSMSSINHMTYWKEIKSKLLPGTANWFETDPSFLQWKSGNQNSILWCSGNLGVGKSVLLSNIVSYLMAHRQPNTMILYHFCRFDQPDSLLARNIIGSLCRQSFTGQLESLAIDKLRELYNQLQHNDISKILRLLSESTKNALPTYILIDGLDECEDDEIRATIEMVSQLRYLQHHHLKILYATRPELEAKISRYSQVNYKIYLAGRHVDDDIHYYIETVLDKHLQKGRLRLGDPTLIAYIVAALAEGAKGMFLWTTLLIDEICDQESDHDIMEALKKLPRDLVELFRRKVERIKSGSRAENAIKTLRYCGLARRPLSVEELQEALSVEVGEQQWDRRRIPNDGIRIVEACCGLVSVNEEDLTIRYAHHSVKHHLFQDSELSDFAYSPQDLQFGFLCLTYLSFPDFDRRVVKYAQPSRVVPLNIGISALSDSSDKSSKVARGLLKKISQSRSFRAANLSDNVQNLTADGKADPEAILSKIQFSFLHYAEVYCIHHLQDLMRDVHFSYWPAFVTHVLKLTATSPPWHYSSPVAIYKWALQEDHGALLHHLLRDGYPDWPQLDFTEIVLETLLSSKKRMSRILSAWYGPGTPGTPGGTTLRSFTVQEISRILAFSRSPQYLEITEAIMGRIRYDPGNHTQYIHAAIAKALVNARADVLHVLLTGYAARPDLSSVKMQSICLHLAILKGRSDIVQALAKTDKTLPAPDGFQLPITSDMESSVAYKISSHLHDASQGICYDLLRNQVVTYEPRVKMKNHTFIAIPMVVAVLLNEMEILQSLIIATSFHEDKIQHVQMALEVALVIRNKEACSLLLGVPAELYDAVDWNEHRICTLNQAPSLEFDVPEMLKAVRANIKTLLSSDQNNLAALEYISRNREEYRQDILIYHWFDMIPEEVIEWLRLPNQETTNRARDTNTNTLQDPNTETESKEARHIRKLLVDSGFL